MFLKWNTPLIRSSYCNPGFSKIMRCFLLGYGHTSWPLRSIFHVQRHRLANPETFSADEIGAIPEIASPMFLPILVGINMFFFFFFFPPSPAVKHPETIGTNYLVYDVYVGHTVQQHTTTIYSYPQHPNFRNSFWLLFATWGRASLKRYISFCFQNFWL